MDDSDRTQVAVERILQTVVKIAYEPKHWTARKLAEEFGTTKRTIYRDIGHIQNAGINVFSEPTGGYYISGPTERIPAIPSQSDHIWLSMIPGILHSIAGTSSASTESLLNNTFRKSGIRRPLYNGLADHILWQSPFGALSSTQQTKYLAEILQAIQHRHTLEITYVSPTSDQPVLMQFDPYFLIMRTNGPYTLGYSHYRKAIRTLKLSRMFDIQQTQHSFTPNDSALDTLDSQTVLGIDNSGEVIEAHIAFSRRVATYVKEDLQATQLSWNEEWQDDKYIVHMQKVRRNPEFLSWILQYGQDAEVLAPIELRAYMRDMTKEMMMKYTGDPTQ